MKKTDRNDYLVLVALIGTSVFTWGLTILCGLGRYVVLRLLCIVLFGVCNFVIINSTKPPRKVRVFFMTELIQLVPAIIATVIRAIVIR